jgi:hypothetical protein
LAVDAYTVITSVAARVKPTVIMVESDAPTVISYPIYIALVCDAPAGRTEIRNVAAVDVKLATEILDTTACVADGTVYRVVAVVADGFDCPRTL